MARGRRPTDEVRQEVLAAAGRLLLEQGMAGFTIEGVAQASGASKVTIYKWWPSKGVLALEGYYAAVEDRLGFPDDGDVEADLRTQLHAFVDLLTTTAAGPAVAALVGQSQSDPELRAAFLASYSSPRRTLAVTRMRAAQDAGDLRADVDPQVVVDQLWGACYHRLLIPDEPVTHAFVDACLDNLFRGLRAT